MKWVLVFTQQVKKKCNYYLNLQMMFKMKINIPL